MADRYLRANGNWNDPVWAATSGGAAGSAATPTADDIVYIAANFTVTLTANAVCAAIIHTNGTLSLSSYSLTVGGANGTDSGAFISGGTTARTINLGSGTLHVLGETSEFPSFSTELTLGGSNLTFNAGTSSVIIDVGFEGSVLNTLSKTFNDVQINMGYGGESTDISISGSPTFRSLIIQSKNSAAHTVNIEDASTIYVNKFVAIGSSSANKLKIQAETESEISIDSSGSSYGQYVSIINIPMGGTLDSPYIGSESTASGDFDTWLLQDPPKISTLVDPLTTAPAENTNWSIGSIVGGSTNITTRTDGYDGGGYTISNNAYAESTDTFDFVDSELIIEIVDWTTTSEANSFEINVLDLAHLLFESEGMSGTPKISVETDEGTDEVVSSIPKHLFIKLEYISSSNKFRVSTSTDGKNFSNQTDTTKTFSDEESLLFKTARLKFVNRTSSVALSYGIGSINPEVATPPTVSTGTPSGNKIDEITVEESKVTANPDSVSISEFGIAYGTSTNPTVDDNKQTGTGTTSDWDATLTGLSENTTYYMRAYVIWGDSNTVTYGSQKTYKTQARPTVTLNTPSDDGNTDNTQPNLRFTGTDADGENITYQLQLNTSNGFDTPLLDRLSASHTGFSNLSTSKTDPFYSGNQIQYAISSALTRGQDYYWRVRGKDPSGSDTWGEWSSVFKFTINPIAPTIEATSVHDVDFDSAEVDVNITSDGGAEITERGAVWSTSPNPTVDDDKAVYDESDDETPDNFTIEIGELQGSTTYYVRGYAINSAGVGYSNAISFQTAQTPAAPTVVTGSAASITDVTARFDGNEVTLDGTAEVIERGIVFSDTNTTPDTDDRKIVAATSGLGEYGVRLTGLDPQTTYYVRAYAVNSIGTGYGEVKTFETSPEFTPDVGDGYWSWSPGQSQATVGRSQATPAFSSVNLHLEDLSLENNKDYTLYIGSVDIDNGEATITLQRYDDGSDESIDGLIEDEITPGTPFSFTYDETYTDWTLRLFVTGEESVVEDITAVFNEMYLAQESEFSGFVPFVPRGVTEVKIINNQIVDDRRDDVIASIFEQVEGVSWYPFEIKTEGLGWFEIGDRLTIKDNNDVERSVVIWNSNLTIDGGISETLYTNKPDLTETDYTKASNSRLRGNIRRTTLQVDKQAGTIEALVSDMYDLDGVVNTKFTEVQQDNESIVATVQGAGGVNLIKNSVMFAFDDEGIPEKWEVDESSEGTITIQASNESLANGAVSGNHFTLNDMSVVQRVTVKKDVDFIPEEQKRYYSLSARVKKNTVGDAYIKLTNRNDELIIELPDQQSYFWDIVKIEEILPQDDHFDIEIYSDSDAQLQVTDLILAPGKTRHEWTQANGEVMNSNMAITEDGITVRSSAFRNNYTRINALGFEVHKRSAEGDRVFGFNDDETNVKKLKSDDQISMPPLRIVPINFSTYKGWAITLSEEDN